MLVSTLVYLLVTQTHINVKVEVIFSCIYKYIPVWRILIVGIHKIHKRKNLNLSRNYVHIPSESWYCIANNLHIKGLIRINCSILKIGINKQITIFLSFSLRSFKKLKSKFEGFIYMLKKNTRQDRYYHIKSTDLALKSC